jgi:hypothetical protein
MGRGTTEISISISSLLIKRMKLREKIGTSLSGRTTALPIASSRRPPGPSAAPKSSGVPVSPSILGSHLPTAPQILCSPHPLSPPLSHCRSPIVASIGSEGPARRRRRPGSPPPPVEIATAVIQVPFPRGVNCRCLSVPSRPYLLATGQKGASGDSAGPLCLRWPGRR